MCSSINTTDPRCTMLLDPINTEIEGPCASMRFILISRTTGHLIETLSRCAEAVVVAGGAFHFLSMPSAPILLST